MHECTDCQRFIEEQVQRLDRNYGTEVPYGTLAVRRAIVLTCPSCNQTWTLQREDQNSGDEQSTGLISREGTGTKGGGSAQGAVSDSVTSGFPPEEREAEREYKKNPN
jgi:hypothetical protein